VASVTCYLLHVMQEPDREAYDDPDLKDVVGSMPKTFCTRCAPILPLRAGEMVRCLGRSEPCWKPSAPATP
jgi:molybdenum cofactor biosynthesis enzyme MoaA